MVELGLQLRSDGLALYDDILAFGVELYLKTSC